MIVGKRLVDGVKLRKIYRNLKALDAYCLRLIPDYARHLPHILDNQKYVVALAIRQDDTIPYKDRMAACEDLLKDVKVKGFLHSITEVEDLILNCDIDKLLRSLFKEELENAPKG